MSCEDLIYSNEYADYIINFQQGIEGAEEIYRTGCVNPIGEEMALLHIPRTQRDYTNIGRVPYAFIPKLFGLMDTSNLEATGVQQIKASIDLQLDGSGVLVGVIDTGIDYTNNLFQNENGESRIGVIWDQSIPSVGQMENNSNVPVPAYGTVYTKEQIDLALQNEETYDVVPSRDENGHGTFMAGIAAGKEQTDEDFQGIASGAELAIVKLKECKPYLREFFGVNEGVPAYEESDIMYAVSFLLSYARVRNMPISIFVGLGSSNGGHLGLTMVEQYLTNVLQNPGIMVSVPAGNEGSERLHYEGRMLEGEVRKEIEFNVDQRQNRLVLEFWGSAPGTYGIGVVSPQGDRIDVVPPRFGSEEEIRLPLSGTEVYIAYQLVETYSGNELVFIRLVNPIAGLWRIVVQSDGSGDGNFQVWMPLRQFIQQETFFLQSTIQNTVTVPGNARLVTTLTSYNHLNNSIAPTASRGYVTREYTKPDMAAPGVVISGPGLRNNIVTRSGTSVAAAHAAGIYALFLQWNLQNPQLGSYYAAQVLTFFLRGAIRNEYMDYPNDIWGYGVMNIAQMFAQFRIIDQ